MARPAALGRAILRAIDGWPDDGGCGGGGGGDGGGGGGGDDAMVALTAVVAAAATVELDAEEPDTTRHSPLRGSLPHWTDAFPLEMLRLRPISVLSISRDILY